jgi:hypothetical protein
MERIGLLALALLATVAPLRSQTTDQGQLSQSSIEISHAKLRLGMTKAEVADKLSDAQIDQKKENQWLLNSGSLIQFENGKLSYASREWALESNEPVDALFRIVSHFNLEGEEACSIVADSFPDPNQPAPNQNDQKVRATVERIRIKCGNKSILIIKVINNGIPTTSVWEILGTQRRVSPDTPH